MKLHWNLERSRSLKPNLPFIDEYHTVPPSSFDRLNFSREIRQLRDFDRSFAGLTHIGRVITTDAFTSCHTVRRFLSETLSLSLSLFLSLFVRLATRRANGRENIVSELQTRAFARRVSRITCTIKSRKGSQREREREREREAHPARFTGADLNFKSSARLLRTSLIFSGIIAPGQGLSLTEK